MIDFIEPPRNLTPTMGLSVLWKCNAGAHRLGWTAGRVSPPCVSGPSGRKSAGTRKSWTVSGHGPVLFCALARMAEHAPPRVHGRTVPCATLGAGQVVPPAGPGRDTCAPVVHRRPWGGR